MELSCGGGGWIVEEGCAHRNRWLSVNMQQRKNRSEKGVQDKANSEIKVDEMGGMPVAKSGECE